LNNGVEIEVLKEILGHANLAATQVYTHNSFARLNEIYQHAHPRERK
jgi:integrase/recombinase XerC